MFVFCMQIKVKIKMKNKIVITINYIFIFLSNFPDTHHRQWFFNKLWMNWICGGGLLYAIVSLAEHNTGCEVTEWTFWIIEFQGITGQPLHNFECKILE